MTAADSDDKLASNVNELLETAVAGLQRGLPTSETSALLTQLQEQACAAVSEANPQHIWNIICSHWQTYTQLTEQCTGKASEEKAISGIPECWSSVHAVLKRLAKSAQGAEEATNVTVVQAQLAFDKARVCSTSPIQAFA